MRKHAINWERVRKSVQANEKALQDTFARNPKRIETVFRQRATHLAKKQAGDNRATFFALIFRLAQERYVIELKELAEVLPYKGCVQVPGTEPKFLGVVNLRGDLRPVIDLGIVLSERPGGDSGFLLILRRPAGLKVDEIEGIREIHSDQLVPAISGHHAQRLLSENLTLLDVETVLSGVLSPKET